MKNKKIRNWKTGIGLLMAVSLLMTGCGGSGKKESTRLEQGSFSGSSIVMKIGDTSVRYSEVRAYCYFLKCQYEGNFGSELWDYPLSDEETIGDQAKQEVVSMITQLKIISAAAEEEDIELSAEEEDSALQYANNLMDKASKKDKREYFLNVQELSEIYQENILAEKMFYIATEDAPEDISDEESRQIAIQYLQVMTEGTDRNGTEIAMDEETKKQAENRARELRRQAADAESFLEFAEQNSDAGQVELTIGQDSESLEKTAVDAAFTLKTGELSQVITGEEGYYIIYCVNDYDEEATYQRKEEIIQERQTSLFMSRYSDWMKNKNVDISESFWDEFQL